MSHTPALLVLEDGSCFQGKAIGAVGESVGEVVFNTSMTGYQEILTDPSYAQQIITFTYPHIGNVGTNPEDVESDGVFASGLIVRDLSAVTSNWRSTQSLQDYLVQHKVVGIADIDTRRLTRLLREKGALRGCITTERDRDAAINKAKNSPSLVGLDLAKEVSITASRVIDSANASYHIVAYDFGIKQNMLRLLSERGCKITLVPAKMTAEEVLALKPDGVFLSNGPGDPAACDYAIKAIKTLLSKNIPIFGICLGFQLLALATGAKTFKMKFGHHGANHPVFDLQKKLVLMTSQNHGFAVDEKTLPADLGITHRSLFDDTLQGIRFKNKAVFGFQGHPEASPGPHDALYLFDEFIDSLEKIKAGALAV